MKTQRNLRVGRGRVRTLWKLSDEINIIAQAIRYANKPADLTYPYTELLQMSRRLSVFREQWLDQWLKSQDQRLERWPKIWERYL